MAKSCGLPDEQKKVFDNIIFDTVVGIIENEKEVYDRFAAAGISENKQGQLIFYIDQYFITPSADEAEVVADLNKNDSESENVSDSQTTTAPSPLQAIKSIQERLTNPIAVAPAVRDQSITKPQQPTSPVENVSETKQIDPYHEPIE